MSSPLTFATFAFIARADPSGLPVGLPADPDDDGSFYAASLLMLGSGTGSDLHHPRAVTMVGSVIVSRQLTLSTILIICLGFDRLENLLRRSFGGGEPQPEGAGW